MPLTQQELQAELNALIQPAGDVIVYVASSVQDMHDVSDAVKRELAGRGDAYGVQMDTRVVRLRAGTRMALLMAPTRNSVENYKTLNIGEVTVQWKRIIPFLTEGAA